jgi:hypothetical protein
MKFVTVRRLFITFIICCFIYGITFPVLNKYYLIPKKWKKELLLKLRENNVTNASQFQLEKYCDCIYLYFRNSYKDVKYFPPKGKFNLADKKASLNCMLNCIISDSLLKENINRNFDSIAAKMK